MRVQEGKLRWLKIKLDEGGVRCLKVDEGGFFEGG